MEDYYGNLIFSGSYFDDIHVKIKRGLNLINPEFDYKCHFLTNGSDIE
jgi:hypothetical protein